MKVLMEFKHFSLFSSSGQLFHSLLMFTNVSDNVLVVAKNVSGDISGNVFGILNHPFFYSFRPFL